MHIPDTTRIIKVGGSVVIDGQTIVLPAGKIVDTRNIPLATMQAAGITSAVFPPAPR